MTIPVSTTTVSITRTTGTGDSYEEPISEIVSSSVRAVVGNPSGGRDPYQEGTYGTRRQVLTCDPVDLRAGDLVTDSFTGREYRVTWSASRPEPLAHVQAGLEDMTYG